MKHQIADKLFKQKISSVRGVEAGRDGSTGVGFFIPLHSIHTSRLSTHVLGTDSPNEEGLGTFTLPNLTYGSIVQVSRVTTIGLLYKNLNIFYTPYKLSENLVSASPIISVIPPRWPACGNWIERNFNMESKNARIQDSQFASLQHIHANDVPHTLSGIQLIMVYQQCIKDIWQCGLMSTTFSKLDFS